MTEFPITIYHNPDCETSRNTLAMLREVRYEPHIVLYCEVGWTHDQLTELFSSAGLSPRQAMREKGTRAAELGLLDIGDEKIFAAMLADPMLVNRPFVTTPLGTRLCRPSERVFDILERSPSVFVKESGEIITRSGVVKRQDG